MVGGLEEVAVVLCLDGELATNGVLDLEERGVDGFEGEERHGGLRRERASEARG